LTKQTNKSTVFTGFKKIFFKNSLYFQVRINEAVERESDYRTQIEMLEKENEKLKKFNSESQAESSYYNARCDSLNVSDYLYYI